MNIEDRKRVALDFLKLAGAGNRADAEKFVAPGARHHNQYFPAGMPALLDAIEEAARQAPNRIFEPKRVIGEGDLVAVHSHVRHEPKDAGVAVVHIFRFDGDLIAEMWDLGQLIDEDSPNTDGIF
jgi:predicted SnoaL-like aldol condensation-catalyzing enzyme